MWDLWQTKWQLEQVFSPSTLVFPSIPFPQCSIKMKKLKKLIIFITGLHKPSGCSASVASAAGPFNKKKGG
jgi:hypothetical protein